jgi:hypothetical protein
MPHLVQVAVCDLLQRLNLVDWDEVAVQVHELNGHLQQVNKVARMQVAAAVADTSADKPHEQNGAQTICKDMQGIPMKGAQISIATRLWRQKVEDVLFHKAQHEASLQWYE